MSIVSPPVSTFMTMVISNAKDSAPASARRAESMISITDIDNGVDIGAGIEVGSGTVVGEGTTVGIGTAVAVGIGVLVGGTAVTVGSGSFPHAIPNVINMNKLDIKNTALTRLSLSPTYEF